MQVTAVGDATEFGKVAEQATVESDEETPLNLQLQRLSKAIGRVGISLAIVTFAALIVKGMLTGDLLTADWLTVATEVLQYFMVAVTLIVVAVPEGLPMSVTLSLAVNMRRMLRTNNLVRKMHASETMGAITVICTDKTGTLTRNEMRVYETKFSEDGIDPLIREGIAANSTAFLDANGKVIGNPTEGALLLWLKDRGADYAALRDAAETVDQMTFTTERKFMATLVDSASGKRILYIKGAPEIILAKCAGFGAKAEVEKQLFAYQNMAMRTLGFAYAVCDGVDTCDEALGTLPAAFHRDRRHLRPGTRRRAGRRGRVLVRRHRRENRYRRHPGDGQRDRSTDRPVDGGRHRPQPHHRLRIRRAGATRNCSNGYSR